MNRRALRPGAAAFLVALASAGPLPARQTPEDTLRAAVARAEVAGDSIAMAEVRTLTGLIPICARCKKVRDEDGYWESVESYIASRSSALFTHGICSTRGPELYGEDWLEGGDRGEEGPEARVDAAGEGQTFPAP
jgi:hypothetical protein